MDIAFFPGQNRRQWAETMINLEARKLVNTANIVAAQHLADSLTRLKFVDEIRQVIMHQFEAVKRARNDEDCIECMKKLRAENESLLEQSRMLKTGYAKVYAEVKYVTEHNKIVGYFISGIKVVLAGVQAVYGGVMIATMTPVGMLAGAVLIGDAVNTVSREAARQFLNEPASQGILADGTMSVAEFMGFSREVGLGVFNATTLAANVYSVFGLIGKAEAWRLFRYVPRDYYRKVDTMSRGKLSMKVIGWGVSAKVVLEQLTNDNRVR
ncbi:DUF4225 domain-containing protein [Cronobacter sakazakii]|nr:DUF4225 domain-containing protein [Cronobacter sakazakii]EJG0748637.1 DUF4225 domain-containing protein [Cronobacter sakazakii]KAB0836044.1 DUF4225 domain-containing protein [Cronobacter sakazakii]KAB0836472.1 DUF4225 domain-containing protein [Cronobacter sakazakii]